ncbi:MAG TPA: class I SAM-dependent methyltransferase [Chloroflexota bacterium]|jgi:SAM-dependent methyltransferase|nr:class I SAM-dependent methyltransferase [Chloroflexota bacterium]
MAGNPALDPARLDAFLQQGLADVGGLITAALVVIGDKLGLYRALAEGGPATSHELAARTGTTERYVREWLVNQAASGYLTYDAASGRYTLPPEQAMALTDSDSPFFVAGAYQVALAMTRATPRLVEAFRSGGGMTWGEHDPELFEGTERFFRPGYAAQLATSWLPALEGVVAKLEAGARVADVGCGHGASTLIMAQAYPRSRFHGFDSHAPSIERARAAATQAGVGDHAQFEVATAQAFPGHDYALIAFFDSFHDMGDAAGAARHAYEALAPDGTVLLVEPMAGTTVEKNFNPIGRIYAGASVLCCTPNAIATGDAASALGTIATDEALREVFAAAGFTRFRRACETPFNRIFEVRK